MGKKGRRAASRRKNPAKGAWRRYGFWVLGITLSIVIVVTGVTTFQGDGNRFTSSATTIPSLSEIPRVTPTEVKAKLDSGSNIAIVDTRSEAEYERAHIVGAISIPLGETTQRYTELDDYNEVITYCT